MRHRKAAPADGGAVPDGEGSVADDGRGSGASSAATPASAAKLHVAAPTASGGAAAAAKRATGASKSASAGKQPVAAAADGSGSSGGSTGAPALDAGQRRTLVTLLGRLLESKETQLCSLVLIGCDIVLEVLLLGWSHLREAQPLLWLASRTQQAVYLLLLLELLALVVAFRGGMLRHAGYLLDAAVLLVVLYFRWLTALPVRGVGLLAVARAWRLWRLLHTLLAVEAAKLDALTEEAAAATALAEERAASVVRLEDALASERDSRRNLEQLVTRYKEELDTMGEALEIAAASVGEAEAAAWQYYMASESGWSEEGAEAALPSTFAAAAFEVASGAAGGEAERGSELRGDDDEEDDDEDDIFADAAGDEGGRAGAKSRVVVSTDGSFRRHA